MLSIARRCGWSVIHTRLRASHLTEADPTEVRAGGVRPLTTERVFLRSRRSLLDSPQLLEQLDQWSRETVYVAAFDPVALISLLIDRLDRGPNFLLVQEAIAANLATTGRAALDPFCSAAYSLAPSISLPALVASLGYQPQTATPLDPRITH